MAWDADTSMAVCVAKSMDRIGNLQGCDDADIDTDTNTDADFGPSPDPGRSLVMMGRSEYAFGNGTVYVLRMCRSAVAPEPGDDMGINAPMVIIMKRPGVSLVVNVL